MNLSSKHLIRAVSPVGPSPQQLRLGNLSCQCSAQWFFRRVVFLQASNYSSKKFEFCSYDDIVRITCGWVQVRMIKFNGVSVGLNLEPSKLKYFEWFIWTICSLYQNSFVNAPQDFTFEGKIIFEWFPELSSRTVEAFEWLQQWDHSNAKAFWEPKPLRNFYENYLWDHRLRTVDCWW